MWDGSSIVMPHPFTCLDQYSCFMFTGPPVEKRNMIYPVVGEVSGFLLVHNKRDQVCKSAPEASNRQV